MSNTSKIFLGIGLPLGVFSFYWFVFRNRQPILNLDNIDWVQNNVTVKFGNNKKDISLGDNGEMNAGYTFNDKLYKLTFKTENKIMFFYVNDKNGKLFDKQTIDFGSKIKY